MKKIPFVEGSHTKVIKVIARGLREIGLANNYLELGVKKGQNFNKIAPFFKKSYAVDIEKKYFKFIKKNNNFHRFCGTTYKFLSEYNGDFFDMVFIDACHTYESSLLDFKTVFPKVSNNGFILMHDTYPPSPKYINKKFCGDCYRTAEWIKKNMLKEVEIVTIPFYFGISIIRKTKKQLNYK